MKLTDEEIIEMAKDIGIDEEWELFCTSWPHHIIDLVRTAMKRQREIDAGICHAKADEFNRLYSREADGAFCCAIAILAQQ